MHFSNSFPVSFIYPMTHDITLKSQRKFSPRAVQHVTMKGNEKPFVSLCSHTEVYSDVCLLQCECTSSQSHVCGQSGLFSTV